MKNKWTEEDEYKMGFWNGFIIGLLIMKILMEIVL